MRCKENFQPSEVRRGGPISQKNVFHVTFDLLNKPSKCKPSLVLSTCRDVALAAGIWAEQSEKEIRSNFFLRVFAPSL